MAIRQSKRRISSARLTAVTRSLLDASTLCAIATVSREGEPHVNTAYFAWESELELFWLSDPSSGHSENIRERSAAAVAVYDSSQTWGNPDRGIQLFGTGRELGAGDEERAEAVYAARFSAFVAREFADYRFYAFAPTRIKLFDEPQLGGGIFVTAAVGTGGRVTWESTEVYET
jgi:uncharacterized protein YhbP (UPF0306 family)